MRAIERATDLLATHVDDAIADVVRRSHTDGRSILDEPLGCVADELDISFEVGRVQL